MINLLKEKYTANKNRGFTLIELIVVMAIIAVLVLLAAPRFMGQTDKAKVAQIQNDVKVAEMKVSEALIDGVDVFDDWSDDDVTSDTLKKFIREDGKLYGRGGPLVESDVEGGDYHVLPRTFIEQEIRSRLEGTFYANSSGEVYYNHGKGLGYSDEKVQDLIDDGYIPVATADELNSIRNDTQRTYGKGTKWEKEYTGGLDKQYVQVANIDLSEYSGEGWRPIGADEESIFTGTYDGGNYVITGLEVKGEGKDYQGLIGYTKEATISNVGLIANKVTGSGRVGGLVGYADRGTMISNSYATGEVSGTGTGKYVGGLVGSAGLSTISDSYATGSVTGTDSAGGQGAFVGGLVGLTSGSTIENSYFTGSVEGTGDYVGGLVGYISWREVSRKEGNKTTTISNSYVTGGSVTGPWGVGGLVGGNNSSTIENSYATAVEVTGRSSAGGLVGYGVSGKIINSYATGPVTGSGEKIGGLMGNGSTSINNSYWDKETTLQSSSYRQVRTFGKTTEEMKKQATYSGWDFDDVWKIDEGNDYPKLR